MKEMFCLCGCGMTVGQLCRLLDGKWYDISPIPMKRRIELAKTPHPGMKPLEESYGK